MAAGYWIKRLSEIPRVRDDDLGAPEWYPLQHHFGLTAFGANIYVARKAGDEVIADHDESESGQEEIYVVTAGAATFYIDGNAVDTPAVCVICVRDASIRRRAVANAPGTTVLAVGGTPREEFASTWRPQWFEDVPRAS